MGYESRLYVVEESPYKFTSDNGKVWAEVIAVIDMCKCYPLANVFDRVANGYIYADDGNTKIEEDCYGAPLGMAELDDVIRCLKKIVKEENYHRAKIALALLKEVQKSMPHCVVYHYGY